MVYITREDDIDILSFSSRTTNCLHRAGIHTVGAVLDYPADEFIKIRTMGAKSVDEIHRFLQSLTGGTGDYALIEVHKQIIDETPSVDQKDISEAIAATDEVMIRRRNLSVIEFAAQIKEDRIREVVQGRLAGKTLNEIGELYGISRERVRQIMQKGLLRKPLLREDKYAYIYDHYDFSLEDFMLAFEEPKETYYYLEMICKTTRGERKPLDEILTDTLIAPEDRKKAERAIYKQYVSIDGVRVKMTRSTLVKHFVKTYCKELTGFDAFFQQYHEWLDALGLSDNPALVIEPRTYENKLNACDYVLWNQWRSFRYYNIPEHDYEELLLTLDLEQYEDVELSSLKLLRDYPELMKQYDIQDEYELHNLLKKIWTSENNYVKFKKMPTIEIGTADRDGQVLSLLLQYAPISGEDFAARYEEAYGIKATTVLANYMKAFDAYFYDGVYSVDSAELPAIQFERMKMVLDCDFYTIREVKGLYKREFPCSDESIINPYTLKTLGFRVYSGYVVKNIYASATDYFRHLLTADEIIDMRNISKSIQHVGAFSSEQYKLRADYEIVEFAPMQYINMRRLDAVGISKEQLVAYCSAVADHIEKGEYFTVKSLQNDGFIHALNDFGFEEWFYSSVLLEDREHFSYQRIGGTRLFLRGTANASLGEMLAHLMEKMQKIDLHDLVDLLEKKYGISLRLDKLIKIIRGTELYYDAIMGTVYINYATYFEEM